MSKNTNTNTSTEMTPEQAMEGLFPPQEMTPEQAMEGLFPTPTPTPGIEEKLPAEIFGDALDFQDLEHRQEMTLEILRAVSKIPKDDKTSNVPQYYHILKECAVDGMIHPGKLSAAITPYLPKNWENALRPDVNKTPEEQLATIVSKLPRSIVATHAKGLAKEYGLTDAEQTRSVKKALRSAANRKVSSKLPIKVAPADTAERQDHILACLAAILAD